MKGAIKELSLTTSNIPINSKIMITGIIQYFFLAKINSKNSLKTAAFMVFPHLKLLFDSAGRLPLLIIGFAFLVISLMNGLLPMQAQQKANGGENEKKNDR